MRSVFYVLFFIVQTLSLFLCLHESYPLLPSHTWTVRGHEIHEQVNLQQLLNDISLMRIWLYSHEDLWALKASIYVVQFEVELHNNWGCKACNRDSTWRQEDIGHQRCLCSPSIIHKQRSLCHWHRHCHHTHECHDNPITKASAWLHVQMYEVRCLLTGLKLSMAKAYIYMYFESLMHGITHWPYCVIFYSTKI